MLNVQLKLIATFLIKNITSNIGNILEWYDFGLFAVFSPLLAELFFSGEDPRLRLISTFSVFAIGYLCRPLGALLFGYLGDRYGRASTLRLSILMISLPTLLIGFLPTYAQLGILAPCLLMLIRIWQGISIGGEYGGIIIYLAETAPRNLRATLTSLASTGANAGILLATMVSTLCIYLFSDDNFKAWGWRLPYLASGLLSLFIYKTRLQLKETPVFKQLKNKHYLVDNPIKITFKKNMLPMLRIIGLSCLGSAYYYFCFAYLPAYFANTFNLSTQSVSILMTIFLLLMLPLVPLAGILCDQVNRRKILLLNAILITVTIIPGYYFLQHHVYAIAVILSLFTILSSLEQASTSVAVVENYPAAARYTGLSLSYNISNGLFGSTVPLICSGLSLSFNLPLAPAFYLAMLGIITIFTIYFFIPDTRYSNLIDE